MKVKFMNFKEMAITQNTGMCSYLTIAWAVPNVNMYVCSTTDQRIGHSTANYSRIMKISEFVPKTIIFEKIKKDKL